MFTPSFEKIKELTEKMESFVKWLAEVIRGKNWMKKLILFDVILFVVFNPIVFPNILKLFTNKPLPNLYPVFFWMIFSIVFIIALIVALRIFPGKNGTPVPEPAELSAIKGLLPFGFKDAELFARLQRQQELKECLEAITNSDFSFGILCGESGCGKSSFLQAGLWPRLQHYKVTHSCVYVKFSDLDPLDSIRQALKEQTKLPKNKIERANFNTILKSLVKIESKTIVLLFDQFEQFFVHRKLKNERKPFVKALAAWYRSRDKLPVKILVCIRSDFSDRLIELQKEMGYSLGPQQSYKLEKFEPKSASKIFRVIAKTEGIEFDKSFLEEITEQELASQEDGLVSPVDMQILAWMIAGQKVAEERRFNRTAYQKLGGIEGLLERYLVRVLEVRETEVRRQAALKILLALTDLERNVRTGVLTLANLKKKLTGTVSADDVDEAVMFLARGDVRLITPTKRKGTLGYELAHERLIPAVRRLASKKLSLVDFANQLLDRRVNEWLGNNRASRYLLRWRELRHIKQQKTYLIWGSKKSQKEALIKLSNRKVYKYNASAVIAFLLIVSALLWLQSPWGQIYLIKRELVVLSKRIGELRSDIPTRVAMVYFTIGDSKQAFQVLENSSRSVDLTYLINYLAEAAKSAKNTTILEQALQFLEGKERGRDHYHALSLIFKYVVEINESTKVNTFLEKARQIGKEVEAEPSLKDYPQEKVSILCDVASFLALMGDSHKADAILLQAYQVVKDMESFQKAWALGNIAESLAKIKNKDRVREFLEEAIKVIKEESNAYEKAHAYHVFSTIFEKVDDRENALDLSNKALYFLQESAYEYDIILWTSIVTSIGRIGEKDRALELLKQRCTGTEKLDSPRREINFSWIARSVARIVESTEDVVFLESALNFADELDDKSDSINNLSDIAEAVVKKVKTAKNNALFERALQFSDTIVSEYEKRNALIKISAFMKKKLEPTEAREILEKILKIALGTWQKSSYRDDVLHIIVKSELELFESTNNPTFLNRAIQLIEIIEDRQTEVLSLCNIAESLAKIKDKDRAREFLDRAIQGSEEKGFYSDKSGALCAIAKTQAKIGSLRLARRIANLNVTDASRAESLIAILMVWGEHKNPAFATTQNK